MWCSRLAAPTREREGSPMESATLQQDPVTPPHPRVLGWVGTAALAMGGSNQMIFLITALFVGQGVILGQGSAAVPLLITGVLLGWAAAPAWTELVLMWPDRVGGIAAACAEAFRRYNPVLSALTGKVAGVSIDGGTCRARNCASSRLRPSRSPTRQPFWPRK